MDKSNGSFSSIPSPVILLLSALPLVTTPFHKHPSRSSHFLKVLLAPSPCHKDQLVVPSLGKHPLLVPSLDKHLLLVPSLDKH